MRIDIAALALFALMACTESERRAGIEQPETNPSVPPPPAPAVSIRKAAGSKVLDAPKLTCSPLPAGAVGCVGTPGDMWGPEGRAAKGSGAGVFPIGCMILLPHSNPYDLGKPQPQECYCQEAEPPATTPRWLCPI